MSRLHFRRLCTCLVAIGMFTFEPSAQENKAEVEPSIQRQIMDLVRQTWEAAKTRDAAAKRRLLADDALDVGEWGIWDKERSAESVATLEKHPGVELSAYSLSDWTFRRASDDVIVVCFKAEMTSVSNGQQQFSVQYASTVWVRRGNTWLRLLFHGSLAPGKTIRK